MSDGAQRQRRLGAGRADARGDEHEPQSARGPGAERTTTGVSVTSATASGEQRARVKHRLDPRRAAPRPAGRRARRIAGPAWRASGAPAVERAQAQPHAGPSPTLPRGDHPARCRRQSKRVEERAAAACGRRPPRARRAGPGARGSVGDARGRRAAGSTASPSGGSACPGVSDVRLRSRVAVLSRFSASRISVSWLPGSASPALARPAGAGRRCRRRASPRRCGGRSTGRRAAP